MEPVFELLNRLENVYYVVDWTYSTSKISDPTQQSQPYSYTLELLMKSDFALTIHWQHYNEMFAFHGYQYKSQLQSQSFCVYNLQYAWKMSFWLVDTTLLAD